MIPRILHLCWISGDPYPEKIQKCVDSWKRVLPDYEIMIWDKQRVETIGSRYVNEAVLNRRYAFAADFIRFYALYTYGGIYMDSDVEVLKPFDDLLGLRYFIGKENSENEWEPAIMGAEAGVLWMREVLKYWKNGKISFTDIWGRSRTSVLPQVCDEQLKGYRIHDCKTITEWQYGEDFICRFPADWFSPKSWETLEINVTGNTYCIHHFAATWHPANNELPVLHSPIKRMMRAIRCLASYIKHDLILRRKKSR